MGCFFLHTWKDFCTHLGCFNKFTPNSCMIQTNLCPLSELKFCSCPLNYILSILPHLSSSLSCVFSPSSQALILTPYLNRLLILYLFLVLFLTTFSFPLVVFLFSFLLYLFLRLIIERLDECSGFVMRCSKDCGEVVNNWLVNLRRSITHAQLQAMIKGWAER